MKRNKMQEVKDAFFVITEIQSEKLSYMAEKNWNYLARQQKKDERYLQEIRPKDTDDVIKKFFDDQKKEMKKYAKVVDGKEVMSGDGQYAIDPEKSKDLDKAMDTLKTKHPEAVKMIEDYNNKYNAFMEEEVEIDFYYAGR